MSDIWTTKNKNIKTYFKNNKTKIIIIWSLVLFSLISLWYKQISKTNDKKTTDTISSSNKIVNRQAQTTIKKTNITQQNFVNIINGFNEQFTTQLPLTLSKKNTDWRIIKEYFSCIPYTKIKDKNLQKIPEIKKIFNQNSETKMLIKKQYEKYCNNLLYTKYPVIFYYNNTILGSQDVLPSVLLRSLDKYMKTNTEKNNLLIVKEFFSYKKIWIIWIIKYKTIWKSAYKTVLESLKWRKIDKKTEQNLIEFNKIIKYYY